MLPVKAISSQTTKYTRYNHKSVGPPNVKSRTAIPVKTYSFFKSYFLFLMKDREKSSQNLTWQSNERHHFEVLFCLFSQSHSPLLVDTGRKCISHCLKSLCSFRIVLFKHYDEIQTFQSFLSSSSLQSDQIDTIQCFFPVPKMNKRIGKGERENLFLPVMSCSFDRSLEIPTAVLCSFVSESHAVWRTAWWTCISRGREEST